MYDDEDHFAPLATPSEAVAEFGRNAGMDRPDRAWLLHDWDVWVKNPFYVGPPVPHPESDYGDDDSADVEPRPARPGRAGEMDDEIPF